MRMVLASPTRRPAAVVGHVYRLTLTLSCAQVQVNLPPDLSKYAKTRKYIDYGVYEDLPVDAPRRPVDPRG